MSKETTLRRAISELDTLRSEKQRRRELKELEQKSSAQKPPNDIRLVEETAKLKNIDQETGFLKRDLDREKKTGGTAIIRKRSGPAKREKKN